MDIKEIKQIVDLMKKSDLTEFAVEEEKLKLHIKRDSGNAAQPQIVSYAAPPTMHAMPAAPVSAEPPAASSSPASEDSTKFITSPMVGTFYTAPSPESDPFAQVGQKISDDSVVCIIEAMKIMNEIQAEKSGTIAEILIENGQPVEFGQRLFRLA